MAIACGFTANTAMAADGNSRGHKSENVAAFARQKYRGCRILDRDTDNGFIELKIRHKNIEKILLFSPSEQWLRTLWDIRREQLPEGVVSGLRSAGFGFRDIDDNDNQAVESPKGRFYAIQARASGHDRIYLVNRRGKVLRSFTDDEWNDGRFPDDRKHHGWDDDEDHFDEGDDEWDDHRGGYRGEDDGEDHFDEGDDEWDDHRGGYRGEDDGEDHFDEGDDEWDD